MTADCQFEVGKFYRTADGTLVRIITIDGGHEYCESFLPVAGICYGSDKSNVRTNVGVCTWGQNGLLDGGTWSGETACPNSRLCATPVLPTQEEYRQFNIEPAGPAIEKYLKVAIQLCMDSHNISNSEFADDLLHVLQGNNLTGDDQ